MYSSIFSFFSRQGFQNLTLVYYLKNIYKNRDRCFSHLSRDLWWIISQDLDLRSSCVSWLVSRQTSSVFWYLQSRSISRRFVLLIFIRETLLWVFFTGFTLLRAVFEIVIRDELNWHLTVEIWFYLFTFFWHCDGDWLMFFAVFDVFWSNINAVEWIQTSHAEVNLPVMIRNLRWKTSTYVLDEKIMLVPLIVITKNIYKNPLISSFKSTDIFQIHEEFNSWEIFSTLSLKSEIPRGFFSTWVRCLRMYHRKHSSSSSFLMLITAFSAEGKSLM